MDTNERLGMTSKLTTKHRSPTRASRIRNLFYRVTHSPLVELRSAFGVGRRASISAMVFHKDGTVTDYGVISNDIVTTAGVNYLAANFVGTNTPNLFNNHDCGTGTTAAAITDTALQTPYGGARATGTQSNPSANIYRTVGTIYFTSSLAITEWGLFSAAAAGTILDHAIFAAINVINGDNIQFTFNLTLAAGG